jgi:hypothetical protein
MEISEQEYEQLKNDANAHNSGREIWCWTKFKKEWVSRVFVAFIFVYTFCVVATFLGFQITTNVMILLGGATLIFMLEKPVGNAISNAKIALELKAGAQKVINTTL